MPLTLTDDEASAVLKAVLDAKTANALEDSQFAYVDAKGARHLPIHDAAHVRNAIARFNQTQFESAAAKDKAAAKIRSAAEKFGVELGDDSPVAKAVTDNTIEVGAFVPITKAEPTEGVIYGVASQANIIDADDHFISEVEVRKAAHWLMSHDYVVRDTHGFQGFPDIPGKIVESHVEGGLWHVAVKPDDAEIVAKAARGEYVGFSPSGMVFKAGLVPPYELKNWQPSELSLVRKGYRPKNAGAVITVVKAEEETQVQIATKELVDAVVARLKGAEPASTAAGSPAGTNTTAEKAGAASGKPTEWAAALVTKIDGFEQRLAGLTEQVAKAGPDAAALSEAIAEAVKIGVEQRLAAVEKATAAALTTAVRTNQTPNVTQNIPGAEAPGGKNPLSAAERKKLLAGARTVDAVRLLMHDN